MFGTVLESVSWAYLGFLVCSGGCFGDDAPHSWPTERTPRAQGASAVNHKDHRDRRSR